jgi:hypothetical protein
LEVNSQPFHSRIFTMAIAKASGYTNLNSGNFSSVLYSKKVQLAFRKNTVTGAITNSDYFGEIASQGDTVNLAA